ncbi:MAG: addiction module antidote protein [Desulfobulbaceae bacterium]
MQSDEDIALYFAACFEEDPGDGSLLARDTGLARESLYRALSDEGNPEFSTVMEVIKALGTRLHPEVLT